MRTREVRHRVRGNASSIDSSSVVPFDPMGVLKLISIILDAKEPELCQTLVFSQVRPVDRRRKHKARIARGALFLALRQNKNPPVRPDHTRGQFHPDPIAHHDPMMHYK